MLKYRIISGSLLGAGVLVIALGSPAWFALLFILSFVWIGMTEVYALLRCGGFPAYNRTGIFLGLVMTTVTVFTAGRHGLALKAEFSFAALVLFVILIRSLWGHAEDRLVEAIAGTLLGICYIPFLFSFLVRVAFGWEPFGFTTPVSSSGVTLSLYLLLVVKVSDIGAYFTGMTIGKHKMFPRVSPKKSWEGAIGGVISSLAVSLLFWKIAGNGRFGDLLIMRWRDAAILGLLLPVSGMVGDLCESQIKRACNAKDSGSIVPGMGGILDVIDSLLFGAPVLYIYAVWFLVA